MTSAADHDNELAIRFAWNRDVLTREEFVDWVAVDAPRVAALEWDKRFGGAS